MIIGQLSLIILLKKLEIRKLQKKTEGRIFTAAKMESSKFASFPVF